MIKKIYLDVDEEITSVIDKIQTVEDAEVSLVFPKESGLLQSIVNLKLIKREAEKLEKSISVITANKIGRNLAEQIGLSVSDHLEEKKETSPKVQKDGGDKVLIEYKEDPKEAEEEEDIVFRKEKLREDDEISVKEEEAAEKEEKEIGTVKGEKPKPDEKAKDIKTKADESLESGEKFKLKSPLKGFGGFVALSIVGLLIFGYVFLPRAVVTISVASEKRTLDATITVDGKASENNFDEGKIKGNKITFTKEDAKKFSSTGKKEAGTKASGTVKIKNSYSTSAQTLVAGTRFESAGLIFKSKASIDVPGYTDAGGGPVAGVANVAVEAENAGSNYNIGPTNFVIPAFSGTEKYSKIIAESSASMSGGESKQVSVVTTADINNAKNDFSKEVVDAAKKEAKEKAEKGQELKDEAIKAEITENSSSSTSGAETDQFTITVKVNVWGLAYSLADLEKAYAADAKKEGGGIKNVVNDGFSDATATVSGLDTEKEVFDLGMKSAIFLSSAMDANMIKDEIIGQTEEKSKAFIMGQEGVKDVSFKFWPSFMKRIPRLKSHINVKAEVSEIEDDKKVEETKESG